MRFGLLTQWYDPEPGPAALPGVLARGLQARGHEVQVVTGFPNYPTGQLAAGYRIRRRLDERLDGVDVRRVALYPSHDRSALRRFANYASFALSATVSGLDALGDLDALWVGCSPVTVGLPMLTAQARFGLPCVTHVLDLWPDTLAASGFAPVGPVSRFVERSLAAWCRQLYRSSASVVYISPGVGPVLQQRGVPPERLHHVPLWADEDVFRPSTEDLRGELGVAPEAVVLVYAGALGAAQDLSSLVAACGLVGDTGLVTLIAGSGTAASDLAEQVRLTGRGDVQMIGRVPQSAMTSLMATADLSYVSLRDHPLSAITMPSKTQAALASGTPLVVAARGDVADVVRASKAGWVVEPGDPASIATALREAVQLGRPGLAALGERGRAYYDQGFSVAQGVARIEELLVAAALSRSRPRRGPG